MNHSGDMIQEIHIITDQQPTSTMEKLPHTVLLKKMFSLKISQNTNLSGDMTAEIPTTMGQLPTSTMEKPVHTVLSKKMFNLMNKLSTSLHGDTTLETHTTMAQLPISITEKPPLSALLKWNNEICFKQNVLKLIIRSLKKMSDFVNIFKNFNSIHY